MADIYAAAFPDTRPWSAEEFRTLLATTGVFAVLCSDGVAMGRVITQEVEVLTIAVHPRAQGRGKGMQLMNDFHQTAADLGGRKVFLEVAEDNDKAIRLYKALGYKNQGRRKGYYRRPNASAVDALVLSKPLCLSSRAGN